MRRGIVGSLLVVVVMLVMVLGMPATGAAQEQPRFSVQWEDITIAAALAALQRQFGIEYVLPSDLGNERVTLALTDRTPVEAVQQVLSAAQLTGVNDNGVWHVRKIAQVPAGERTYRPSATAPAAVATGAPAPYRVGPQGVNVGAAFGAPQPAFGAPQPAFGATWAATAAGGPLGLQQYAPEDLVFRIIPLKFVDPWVVTAMFGGYAVGGAESGGGYDDYDDGYGGGRRGSSRDGGYGDYGDSRGSSRSRSSRRSSGYGDSYGSGYQDRRY